MSGLFLTIVNMSISAGWMILAVLMLRLLFKKAPKWISVLLWGLVAIRLVCPFSIESALSLIPSTHTISKAPHAPRPYFESGFSVVDDSVNEYLQGHYFEGVTRPAEHFLNLTALLAILWLAGLAVLLMYTGISYLRLKRKVGTAVRLRDNIFQSEAVVSPFVLGLIRPKIYLPFHLNERDMEQVIAHETAHIQRKDHLWKPLGFLILALHWFNPLVWLGYLLLCRDIELACDEKVIQALDTEQKADYSQALLACSVNRRVIAACPLAFGEVGVKNRVKSVLNYKKPAFWLVVTALILSVVATVCFLTDPLSNRLGSIENCDFNARTAETTFVSVSDGIHVQAVGAVDQAFLERLYDLAISQKEISLSRSEDRDKSHTLILNLMSEYQGEVMQSYSPSTQIHFNADFTSVWVNDSVKPTFSYEVLHPEKAKELFDEMAASGSAAENESVAWTGSNFFTNTHQLKAQYPQFFNVSTDGGLTVYVWQMAENSYRCHLANTAMEAISDNSFAYEVGVSIPQMRAILATYGVEQKEITVQPIRNPLSSYLYEIDDPYRSKINTLFWSDMSAWDSTLSYANYASSDDIYQKALNLDKLDINSVRHLPIYKFDTRKELERFQTDFGSILTMNGGYGDVPSFREATDHYGDAFFKKNSLLLIYVSANNTTHRFHIAGISRNLLSFTVNVMETTGAETVDTAMSGWFLTLAVPDDWVKNRAGFDAQLTEETKPTVSVSVGSAESVSVSSEVVPLSENLSTAIAKALREQYQADKPDGLLHTETYRLLAHQTASGTPLQGNSGHMEKVTVYLLVYHMKYSLSGGRPEEVEGDFVPTALTFSVDEAGQYTLEEYWTPQAGANNEKEVRGKFPGNAAQEVLDTEKYAEDLIQESFRQATDYLSRNAP